MITRFI